jgi:ATP-dependent Clp protease ATP-binding subunit ClpC
MLKPKNDIFGRFTDRARKIVALANQEAKRLNHDSIDTEHVLLGLIKEGSGVGANALKDAGVALGTLRIDVERLLQSGDPHETPEKLPQTPQSKKVIEYSILAARGMTHNYVGSEHILLGLIQEQGGIAGSVLRNRGLNFDLLRQKVLHLWEPPPT